MIAVYRQRLADLVSQVRGFDRTLCAAAVNLLVFDPGRTDTLWGQAKDVISANKQYEPLDDQVERFIDYINRLSDRQALHTAGVLSKNFWLGRRFVKKLMTTCLVAADHTLLPGELDVCRAFLHTATYWKSVLITQIVCRLLLTLATTSALGKLREIVDPRNRAANNNCQAEDRVRHDDHIIWKSEKHSYGSDAEEQHQ